MGYERYGTESVSLNAKGDAISVSDRVDGSFRLTVYARGGIHSIDIEADAVCRIADQLGDVANHIAEQRGIEIADD